MNLLQLDCYPLFSTYTGFDFLVSVGPESCDSWRSTNFALTFSRKDRDDVIVAVVVDVTFVADGSKASLYREPGALCSRFPI